MTGTVAEEQKRFFAIKLLEKDDKIVEQMKVFRMFLTRSNSLRTDLMMIPRVLLQTSVMYTFLPSLADAVQKNKDKKLYNI